METREQEKCNISDTYLKEECQHNSCNSHNKNHNKNFQTCCHPYYKSKNLAISCNQTNCIIANRENVK